MFAAFPSPPANGISLGPIDLRFYGLMIAIGILVAIRILGSRLESRGAGSADDASAIGLWGAVGGLIGARLYHVATEWDRFADDLGAIPAIWKGGLGIPGGIALGVVFGVWTARRRGVGVSSALWAAAPAIPVAQAIGRWGNWFNQELFGRETDLWWGLSIDDAHLPAGYASGTLFHPTFLYESLWNLAVAWVVVRVGRSAVTTGRLMWVYVAGYGVGRFWVEGLRIDPADSLAGLRWNQWVALAWVVAGVIGVFAGRRSAVPALSEHSASTEA